MTKINDRLQNAPQVLDTLAVSKQRGNSQAKQLTTSDNSLDVAQPQHIEGQILSAKVYVLDINGNPLMPTSPRKARILLKQGKAIVKRRTPFVIQLNYKTTSFIQEVRLGEDSGSKNIGFSAVSGKEELISGTVNLDTMMKKRIADRLMYRRSRRNRLWYREPRFNNRKRTVNWLPPSIERRYHTHLSIIDKIKAILPVSNVTIELGNFDTQRINNPEIAGKEYQQGDRYGYENTKAYIIAREKTNCQLCGKTVIGKKINLHHIESRKTHGDKASNLALLHDKCHKKLHKQGLTLKKNKQFREHTFMNIMQAKISNETDYNRTFGYKTFVDRINLGIPKTHNNDAFVIAGGTKQIRVQPFEIIQKRKNNRAIQQNYQNKASDNRKRSYCRTIRKQKYKLQSGDYFWIGSKRYICAGLQNLGTVVCYFIDKKRKTIALKNITDFFNNQTLRWEYIHPNG